jgi:hypothetical protein
VDHDLAGDIVFPITGTRHLRTRDQAVQDGGRKSDATRTCSRSGHQDAPTLNRSSRRVHLTRSRLRSRGQRPVTDPRRISGIVFVRHGVLRRRRSPRNGKTSTVFPGSSFGSYPRAAALPANAFRSILSLPTDLEERPAPTFDEDPDTAVVHSAALPRFLLHGSPLCQCSL